MDAFTPRERLLRRLEKKDVERSPVICPGGMMNSAIVEIMNATGHTLPAAHTDAGLMADLAEDVMRYTGFENLGVPFCMNVETESTAAKNRTLKILDEGKSFSYELCPAYAKRFDGAVIHLCPRLSHVLERVGALTAEQIDLDDGVYARQVVRQAMRGGVRLMGHHCIHDPRAGRIDGFALRLKP